MHTPLIALFLVTALTACTRHALDATPPQPPRDPAIATGETVAALDNRMWIVFQAIDRTYWFGSNGQGIYRFDGKTIVRFTTLHGLGGDHIRSIQEDCAGSIFVCSEPGGVSRFDGRTFSVLPVADSSKSVWKLGPDDLWFPAGQDTGAVYRWDGTSLHRLAFPATAAGDAHHAAMPRSKYPNADYSPYDVYTIFKDSKGHLWFGTAILGACRFDGTSFAWAGHGENGSFGVRSIVEDKDGTFWLSNCVSRFAEDPNAAARPGAPRFRKEPGIATDADPYAAFMSTVRDKDGVLWLATLGAGVFRYDGTEWTHFPVTHDDKPIWVYSIYRDREDALWLGTQEHGVYKFNGRTFEKFQP
jgi:ligand-binding sensor domain-containing protein